MGSQEDLFDFMYQCHVKARGYELYYPKEPIWEWKGKKALDDFVYWERSRLELDKMERWICGG